jgi:hypothetical protein
MIEEMSKPNLILWLLSQLLLAKLPLCLMFLAILYVLGVPWEYGLIVALYFGNVVHNLYDNLNDEVVRYIDNKIKQEAE